MDVRAALVRLPQRPRQVIELRYGLRDGVPRTADAVAAELGVARERVRTIELQTAADGVIANAESATRRPTSRRLVRHARKVTVKTRLPVRGRSRHCLGWM